jgi:hypothetical protein
MLTIYIKLLSIMARIVNTRLKGKAFRCDVTGKFETCEACSVGKVRQKYVNKE